MKRHLSPGGREEKLLGTEKSEVRGQIRVGGILEWVKIPNFSVCIRLM